jgi:GxxExxY protein
MGELDRNPRRFEDGTREVIAGLIEVHRRLGPGLLESAYEACVCAELSSRGFAFERQVEQSLKYRNVSIECGYRLDVVVDGRILLELKSVERLLPIHEAQVITYLKLSGLSVGLLVNFNVSILRDGLRRLTAKTPNPSELPNFL